MLETLIEALTFRAGYNAALVAVGTTLLGIAAGSTGTFIFLRRRALISDAVAHATLPGVGLAFIALVALGGDGRNLPALVAGSAVSAWVGLLVVQWITRQTRLAEDAAIGAVLSVFFGLGIVLLTVIQNMSSGRQAGLEDFLLGAPAGMLLQDAIFVAVAGLVVLALVIALRRPMTLVAFDPAFATSVGISVHRTDLVMMALAMAITVVGLKLVGLILIVALLIIPPAAARFWSDKARNVVWIAGVVGGVSGFLGAGLSASAPAIPTGPIIVLVCFCLFAMSMAFAPRRGVIAALARQRQFRQRVRRRQGLLALAREEEILDPATLALLRREGLIRTDGVATDAGRAQAARARRDERRWEVARATHQDEAAVDRHDLLRPIEEVLTRDEIAEIDARLGPPEEAAT
ncbi:MAG: metal ABC transporter permease [Alphaproteobacteria bacterium]|nr:metal ABC transporter permease [Alphaproteobacteria bacterium]